MAIELLFERMPSPDEVRAALAAPIDLPALPPWLLGRAYASLQDLGYGQKWIAKAVEKTQTHVSRCITIYQGLAPKTHQRLCQLGKGAPNILQILELARLRTEDEEPDETRQLSELRVFCDDDRISVTLAGNRLLQLREMLFPPHVAPVVAAVLGYLSCETDSLSFPEPTCRSAASAPARPPRKNSPTPSTGSTARRANSGSSTRGGSRRT